MKLYGLIGYPLTHSFSSEYFLNKFKTENINDVSYKNFPLKNIEDLPKLLNDIPDIKGLNVTIPYKEKIIKFIDELSEETKKIAAVNTIKISRIKGETYLTGYNTDKYGFQKSFTPLLKTYHKNALVLGSGGGAKAVSFVLKKLNIEFKIVSRNPVKGKQYCYKDINRKLLDKYKIIINTTPVGMYPEINSFPDIPYDFLTEKHLLYDLVYNPAETTFLKKGKLKKTIVKNGYDMLKYQAEKSWEIWTE